MLTHPATILIVDDQLANCELLEGLLRPEGYLTVCATSGEKAMAAVGQMLPDLILLDVMMPGMDGNEVATRLKANPATSGIPIIMVTAQDERSSRLASLSAGAEDFLTKPVIRAELWLRVRNLLRLKTLSDFQKIHERDKARETLRQSAEEFLMLAELMPQIVWITRQDGWNAFFNQKWMDYTGLTIEESLGHWGSLPFHAEDQERAWNAWQHAITAVGGYSLHARLRRADGVYRWFLVQGVPQLDTDGSILKWLGICTDVHDLKMAQLESADPGRACLRNGPHGETLEI